jgi:hypothetical protein
MFHPNYLCNISRCFIMSAIFFSLIFNKILISLHSCLDLTHKIVYKETADPIIFIIHVLRLSNTLYRRFFYSTTKFFKNITLHIKLKTPPHHTGLQTSYSDCCLSHILKLVLLFNNKIC